MNKDRLQILMVLENMGTGGTETYALELANYLRDKAGVRFFCLSGDANIASLAAGRPVEVARKGLRGWMDLIRALRATRGGVAHLHLYTSLLRVMLLCRLVGGLRAVSTFHMPLRDWNLRHRIAWRGAAMLSDVCVGVSSDCVEALGRYARGKTDVIPAALPATPLPRKTRRRLSSDRTFVVAGSGRLSREKNWAVLIEAVAAIRRRGAENLVLELFGDGLLRSELEALAVALGIADAVNFHGFTPRDQMLQMLIEADLFVLPSNFEGLGISAVEAMAVGLPTITSDFPASRDYIEEGETGDRFPRGDAEALAQRIRHHFEDPDRSARMAEEGRAYVLENFSADRTFGRYPQLYESERR